MYVLVIICFIFYLFIFIIIIIIIIIVGFFFFFFFFFFLHFDSRLVSYLVKKLSFWLSACSVLIVVSLL